MLAHIDRPLGLVATTAPGRACEVPGPPFVDGLAGDRADQGAQVPGLLWTGKGDRAPWRMIDSAQNAQSAAGHLEVDVGRSATVLASLFHATFENPRRTVDDPLRYL